MSNLNVLASFSFSRFLKRWVCMCEIKSTLFFILIFTTAQILSARSGRVESLMEWSSDWEVRKMSVWFRRNILSACPGSDLILMELSRRKKHLRPSLHPSPTNILLHHRPWCPSLSLLHLFIERRSCWLLQSALSSVYLVCHRRSSSTGSGGALKLDYWCLAPHPAVHREGGSIGAGLLMPSPHLSLPASIQCRFTAFLQLSEELEGL